MSKMSEIISKIKSTEFYKDDLTDEEETEFYRVLGAIEGHARSIENAYQTKVASKIQLSELKEVCRSLKGIYNQFE